MRSKISLSLQPAEDDKIRKLAIYKSMTVSEYIRYVMRKHWEEETGQNGHHTHI